MKHIAILGSTGSIGTQALDVVEKHSDLFVPEILVANNNVELLAQQAIKFRPRIVVIGNEAKYNELCELLKNTDTKVFAGQQAVVDAAASDLVDTVLVALVGFSGLRPTRQAIEAHKTIALANKETLVVAGEYIMSAAKRNGVHILPVDSEHSAIFQCLNGERHLKPEKIILTASGGPFRGRTEDDLRGITPAQALKHPNWNMGAKVTIDSASLMNKGLESIEAKWLFDVEPAQIEIVVHPQSIVHSLVEFADGSLKAQIGMPDMRLPIQYALTYPDRLPCPAPRFHFAEHPSLTFEQPDTKLFRNLPIAHEAMRRGGNAPCIMNGANEVAVAEFLNGRLPFLSMPDVIEYALEKCTFCASPSFDDYFDTDIEARKTAREFIEKNVTL
ncbi:MAG: 1-deoxy-D-xylulose-5-phosphate reductoisomerase [Bacteroidales bacterium]|nr:1-deoxy-D-xylulose-5-phosphate reductoisomerase [Bacteroidales bacterium]